MKKLLTRRIINLLPPPPSDRNKNAAAYALYGILGLSSRTVFSSLLSLRRSPLLISYELWIKLSIVTWR